MIRTVSVEDAGKICAIYNHYVENTVVTFEETPVSTEEMAQRIKGITEDYPWIVFEENGRIEGYAYAGKWKLRRSYRFTLELTIYLHKDATGKGIGSKLYGELLDRVKQTGCHVVIGVISLPNEGSCRLHEKFGFTEVARYSEVGYKFGKWIDVVSWELKLATS